jgi:hypothetical protein
LKVKGARVSRLVSNELSWHGPEEVSVGSLVSYFILGEWSVNLSISKISS